MHGKYYVQCHLFPNSIKKGRNIRPFFVPETLMMVIQPAGSTNLFFYGPGLR